MIPLLLLLVVGIFACATTAGVAVTQGHLEIAGIAVVFVAGQLAMLGGIVNVRWRGRTAP